MANIKMSAFAQLLLSTGAVNTKAEMIALSGVPEVGKPKGKNVRIKLTDFIDYIKYFISQGAGMIFIVDSLPPLPTPDDDGIYILKNGDGTISLYIIDNGVLKGMNYGDASAKTAIRFVSLIGIDTSQPKALWVKQAINKAILDNGNFTCDEGEQMVFKFNTNVVTDGEGGVVTMTRLYFRLISGANVVSHINSYATELMPDGQDENVIITNDLIINLGDIGTDDIEDAFNSDVNEPFDMTDEMFVQAIQNGEDKLWQWIGGTGSFGNSGDNFATDAMFVDLTAQPNVPVSDSNVFYDYNTTALMIADQATQTNQKVYQIKDASDDTNITFVSGETKLQAFYRFEGSATGSIDDYTLVSVPYGNGGTGGISDGDKGDITVSNSGADWDINNKKVTNAKLADVPTKTFKGRTAAGTGVPKDLTKTEALAILNVQDGANKNVKSNWNATTGDPEILNKPTKLSEFTNDLVMPSGAATEETGTAISLSNVLGSGDPSPTPYTDMVFTIGAGAVFMGLGWRYIKTGATEFPTVTDATYLETSPFEANEFYRLWAWDTGARKEYWFEKVPEINPITPFVFKVDTSITGSSNSTSFKLPIANNSGEDIKIDWGDGSGFIDYDGTFSPTKDYGVSGIYTIKIIGLDRFNGFRGYGISSEAKKLVSVEQWSDTEWLILAECFSRAENLVYNATDIPDLSNVTSLSTMFKNAALVDFNAQDWDVSNITTMFEMFLGVTLSTANYDALLIGWAALPSLKTGVDFHGGGSKYTGGGAAQAARLVLTSSPNNWDITDGGTV